VIPLVTIVTDNSGPYRSFPFEAFIATHSELRHVCTRVRTPGQNGSRERGFGSLKYEKLFLEEIPDALDLVAHAEDYRVEYNTVRPHEALAWNRPLEVHLGLADPLIPNFPQTGSASCLTRDTRTRTRPPGRGRRPDGGLSGCSRPAPRHPPRRGGPVGARRVRGGRPGRTRDPGPPGSEPSGNPSGTEMA
jgi:hypothetical protein